MMDHRSFLATLSPDERKALTAKSDVKGLLHFALYLSAITICVTLIWLRIPAWPLVMLPLGILLVFLFTLLHETSHATVFRTFALNRWVAALCGAIVLIPPAWFRYFHFAHHRFTHVPGKDPELAAPKPQTQGEYLRHLSGIPIWISSLRTLLQNATGKNSDDFVPTCEQPAIEREAQILIGIYGLIATVSLVFGSAAALIYWVIPLLLGQPFLRLYLLAEHADCAHDSNMFVNTRTTFTTRLVRFLAWNMPYHAEHHAYPAVPFHKLPDLHVRASTHLQVTADGYSGFHAEFQENLS